MFFFCCCCGFFVFCRFFNLSSHIYCSSLLSSSIPFRRPSAQFFWFVLSFLCVSHRITLEIMTLQPKCEDVETAEGVALTVTGVAQVNPEHLLFFNRFLFPPVLAFNLSSFLAPVPDLFTQASATLKKSWILFFILGF